jgi:glucokinase
MLKFIQMEKENIVMGVDVGSTKILAGLVDPDGRILASKRFAMDRSDTFTTLNSIYGAIESFLSSEDCHAKPLAAGIGLVGRCDPLSGCWVRADNLPIHKPVEIASEIKSRFGLNSWIDNDVFCAAQAEIAYGAGKKYRDFLLLNVGTGLSAAIVSDGRLVRGAGNVAGEVGQWRFPLEGNMNALNLEEISSGGGMIARARDLLQKESSALAALPKEELHSLSIYQAAGNGDALGKRIISDALNALRETVSRLVTMLNPAAVVLAGSVVCAPGFPEEIRSYVLANSYPGSLLDLKEICLSELDPRAVGLIGAARVAWKGVKNA